MVDELGLPIWGTKRDIVVLLFIYINIVSLCIRIVYSLLLSSFFFFV